MDAMEEAFQSMEEVYQDFHQAIEENTLKLSLRIPLECNNLLPHHKVQLIEEIVDFYKISNSQVIQKLQEILDVLEGMEFFQDNIGLYVVGITFAFELTEKFPHLVITYDDVLFTILMCLMITNKFYVDNSLTNRYLAHILNLDLQTIVAYEFRILSELDFQLPFTLFVYE